MERTPSDSRAGGRCTLPARLTHRRLWVRSCIGVGLLLWGLGVSGCTAKQESPAQRAEAAKTLFERASKQFHGPSAEARGADKLRLQEQAAAGYQELLRKYPDQDSWAAPALRHLGDLRAAQTNVTEAVRLYAAVEQRYPRQDWEVCMALKSAADLLWDAGGRAEARPFYEKVVARFDTPDAPQVVKLVVRGSRSRLAE